MVTKRQIDKLTEDLTGRELAFLSIQYMEDVDHDREPAYTQDELDKMKRSIDENVREHRYRYERWLDLYQALRYYIENAKIRSLKARNILNKLSESFLAKSTDRIIKWNKQKLPIPMTEKEYNDKKEIQKEKEFNKYHCIDEVISKRASKMFEEDKEELPKGDSYYPEFIKENYPKYYKKAEKQINEMIDDDLLTPVEKGSLEEWIKENKTKKELENYNSKFKTLAKNMEFKELERLENNFFDNISTWPDKEELGDDVSKREVWLYQTFIKGEELYNAELPEWEEWIGEYKPNLYGYQKESEWSWLGEIAIVKNPDSSNVDDKGWYKKDDILNDVVGIEYIEDKMLNELKKEGTSIQEVLETNHTQVMIFIKDYKSVIDLLKTFSEIIGTDLTEDLTSYTQVLKEAIKDYNSRIDHLEKWSIKDKEGNSEKIDLKTLKVKDFEDIQRSKEETQELKDLFTSVLGQEWWLEDRKEVVIND